MAEGPLEVPLKLRPNVRFEKRHARTGYVWGQPTGRSSILRGLNRGEWVTDPAAHPTISKLGIEKGDIVAERWIVADDRTCPSVAELPSGETVPLPELLESAPAALLGPEHAERHGPYLGTVMKLLDTHDDPTRGGLSVQVHPPEGYVGRPPKPEMWKGRGRIYLGWRREMDEAAVRNAVAARDVERLMNELELRPDDLVIVPGGFVHAIRAGTFTAEWSMAPGRADAEGGNDLKHATATLYDGTDGRSPRPGKEDLESALDIMARAGGFAAASSLTVRPVPIADDGGGNVRVYLFRTPQVFVEEWRVRDRLRIAGGNRGFGLFVEAGEVSLVVGRYTLRLAGGEEAFVPAGVEGLEVTARRAALIQRWYAPFARERSEQ
jgi:mannose-6-phosphate isomerase class I